MQLKWYKVISVAFIACILCYDGVIGQTYENVTNLHNALLASYNPSVRPVHNQGNKLQLNVTLSIYQLLTVDAVRGTFELVLQVMTKWTDEHMIWDPADYGGLNSTTFENTEVFTPKLSMTNQVDFDILTEDFMSVKYDYTGAAFFDPAAIPTMTCTFEMKYWPFDKQICFISLFSYGFSKEEIELKPAATSLITAYFNQGGEWWVDLDSFETKEDSTFYLSQLHFKFKMQRLSTSYVLTMILPIVALGFLSSLSFLLPNDADTRVGYNMTIMLALAVFLSVVSDDVPKGSDTVPIFCVFLVYALCLSTLLMVIIILNARIFVRSSDIPVTSFFKKLVKVSKFSFKNKVQNKSPNKARNNRELSIKEFNMNEHQQQTKYKQDDITLYEEADDNISWEDVSNAIDKLILIIMVPCAYFVTTILLICNALLSDYIDHNKPF